MAALPEERATGCDAGDPAPPGDDLTPAQRSSPSVPPTALDLRMASLQEVTGSSATIIHHIATAGPSRGMCKEQTEHQMEEEHCTFPDGVLAGNTVCSKLLSTTSECSG